MRQMEGGIDDQWMERVVITPESAKEMLANMYDKQRMFRKAYSAAYKMDMVDGNWNQNNPQPIVLSKDGKLLDGQHRLNAIVDSGIPCMMWVCHGVDERVFEYIDSGHTRSLNDRDIDIPNKNVAFSLARRIIVLDRGESLSISQRATSVVTQRQIIDKVMSDKDHILVCIRSASRIADSIGKGPVGSYALVVHMASVIFGDAYAASLENHVKEPNTSSMTLQKHIMRLYANSVGAKSYEIAPTFLTFCDDVLSGKVCKSITKKRKDAAVAKWEDLYRGCVYKEEA